MEISSDVVEAFSKFKSEPSHFAFLLEFLGNTLKALPPTYYPKALDTTFQQALNQLENVLSPKQALYIILRRNDALVAITFVPHLASKESKAPLLERRVELVKRLGESDIHSSIICKEIGEITDVRSWNERDGNGESWNATSTKECQDCKNHSHSSTDQDQVYKKNKCRLCDRRMKNPIDRDALAAFQILGKPGACVQLVIPSTNPPTLTLTHPPSTLSPSSLSAHLPTATPSFTFYRHPVSQLLYFIFHSPDSAPVQTRMTHTMAIAGLVNVIAKDAGAEVERKVEIHEPGELKAELERGEEQGSKGGNWKGRSMYLLGGGRGTESIWEGME